jgi:hypothetical protein
MSARQLVSPNQLFEYAACLVLDGLGLDEINLNAGSRENLNTAPWQPPIPSREQATPDFVSEILQMP